MAVRLRMKRMGSKKRPFYRLVAADTRYQRDGRFLEVLGYYDPLDKPFKFVADREKIVKWLEDGAQMSKTAEGLLRREGIVQEFNVARQTTRPVKDAEVAEASVEDGAAAEKPAKAAKPAAKKPAAKKTTTKKAEEKAPEDAAGATDA